MNSKALGLLAAVSIILVGLALYTSRSNTAPKSIKRPGEKLLPSLPLNDIESVTVTTEGNTAVIARKDGTWVVESKYGFPANFGKLREQLLKLSDLKIGQIMTVDDAQKEELKVTGNSAGSIVLSGAGNTQLASVILGDTRERPAPEGSPYGGYPDGRFVSADEGKSVYLVGDALTQWSGDAMQWVDTELLNIQGVEVTSITITPADGEPIVLSRVEKDGELELEGLADDEAFDTSKRYSLQSALSYFRFEDLVAPDTDEGALGFAKADRFEVTTKANTRYTVLLGGAPEDGSGRYCRISATALTNEVADAETTAEEDAAALNAKVARWTYVIPDYKAETMAISRSDLIKKPEEAADTADEDNEPEPAPPAPIAVSAPEEPVTEKPAVNPDTTPDVAEAAPEESLGTPVEAPVVEVTVPEAEPEEELALTSVEAGPQPEK